MEWKVDSTQPIDTALRDMILDRIEEGTFGTEDLKDFFTIYTQIANNTEDIQDEVEGFDRKFQFRIEGLQGFWMTISKGKFEMGSGDIEGPDITLEMGARVAVEIFSGQVDPTAAYMNGELRVNGIINDAIQFRTILELVQEELE